jgi:hypothetical protein
LVVPIRRPPNKTERKQRWPRRKHLYVYSAHGVDTNVGTKDTPLRMLAEAARRVNESTGSGPMTIVLAEGIYAIGQTVVFKPEHRSFSKTARLTIRSCSVYNGSRQRLVPLVARCSLYASPGRARGTSLIVAARASGTSMGST